MAKYRKKPIIVDAERWYPGVEVEGVDSSHATGLAHGLPLDTAWVDTLEGGSIVSPGDWIITGVRGEKYPCKPDIFEMTYEPV